MEMEVTVFVNANRTSSTSSRGQSRPQPPAVSPRSSRSPASPAGRRASPGRLASPRSPGHRASTRSPRLPPLARPPRRAARRARPSSTRSPRLPPFARPPRRAARRARPASPLSPHLPPLARPPRRAAHRARPASPTRRAGRRVASLVALAPPRHGRCSGERAAASSRRSLAARPRTAAPTRPARRCNGSTTSSRRSPDHHPCPGPGLTRTRAPGSCRAVWRAATPRAAVLCTATSCGAAAWTSSAPTSCSTSTALRQARPLRRRVQGVRRLAGAEHGVLCHAPPGPRAARGVRARRGAVPEAAAGGPRGEPVRAHLELLDCHARVSARCSAIDPRLAAPVAYPNVAKANICGNSSNMNCSHLRERQLKVFGDHEDHMITCRGLSEERISDPYLHIHATTFRDVGKQLWSHFHHQTSPKEEPHVEKDNC
ncbi:serine/arginine repetitive matrix protein 1-like [Hordeum vulgare subsp. vulgare]|uniref:serine/arginine repetitive matrix protein 1-like n=1 Tax=Hordeum vulgare subsp. vulgare TaxID=112509 RepID=UPI001D1A4BC3|nr:serine/arginine repetitive matrix protein 1-like [Hordeum vulgare subsp. vulgare]